MNERSANRFVQEITDFALSLHDEFTRRRHDYFLFNDSTAVWIGRVQRSTNGWLTTCDA